MDQYFFGEGAALPPDYVAPQAKNAVRHPPSLLHFEHEYGDAGQCR